MNNLFKEQNCPVKAEITSTSAIGSKELTQIKKLQQFESQIKQVNFMQSLIIIFNKDSMCSENPTLTPQENNSFSSQVPNKAKKSPSSEVYSKKWTVPENILYARYLKTHMSQMTNSKKKKCGKFVKMANFIGSKTENQCRSHHQKMMLTFKSIQNIINYAGQLKKRGQLIMPQEYQQKFTQDLEISDQNQKMGKIEEQLTTERQLDQTIHQQKEDEIKIQNCFLNDLPIIQEESSIVACYFNANDIFDVLSIDAVDRYSQYFSC